MALPGRYIEGWVTAVGSVMLLFLPFSHDLRLTIGYLALLFLSLGLLFLFRVREIADVARETAFALFACMYVPFMLMHLVELRLSNYGISWLLLIMFIVMSGDSAAYYVGSALGKHRLYPLVSPKKSIEGSLGGLGGSLCGTLLAKYTFFPQLSLFDAVLTALLIGTIGQLGDLFESMLKRSCGVKDSGTLFPGHGGVLDRLDSILFAAPVTYYYAVYLFKG